jgi:hypothetical protein
LTGKEQPLGTRVDIGNPENGDAALGNILFVQEFEKNFTETSSPDNPDVGIMQIFDHGEFTVYGVGRYDGRRCHHSRPTGQTF